MLHAPRALVASTAEREGESAAWRLQSRLGTEVSNMRSLRTLAALALIALAPGCVGSFGAPEDRFQQPPPGEHGEVPTPACPADPDCNIGGDCSLYVCPDYWICEDQPDGTKRCLNPGPAYPDGGGDWVCADVSGTTECRRPGSDFPDQGGGSEWSCEARGEFVVCTDTTPSYPDGGDGGPYHCWFANEFRVCATFPGDGGGWVCHDTATGRECRNDSPDYPDDRVWSCWDDAGRTFCRTAGGDLPDGGGGSEWYCEAQGEFVVCTDDTPDYPDDGGGTPYDCRFGDEFRVCTTDIPDGGDDECVPGTERWCDDAVYCSWGKQGCLPDGTWGACIEPTVSRDGLADRPDTACGCRFFYFNAECCEDQEDRNGDGAPDCIIPAAHTPPACTTDGGLCSYCDSHTDCGGDADLCIFRSDGYAMCGRDCSTEGCPAGYSCQPLTTRSGTVHQCAPTTGSCE